MCPLAHVTEPRRLGSRLIDSVPDPLTLVSLVTAFQGAAKCVWQESTEVLDERRARTFKADDRHIVTADGITSRIVHS